MTKISTEHFPTWLQYQSQNTDAFSKAELKENKDFKGLKNYIVGEWKTYLIKETKFYVESQSYRKSIILDNLIAGIDSIIFQKCIFDCEVTISLQSDKFKFIFFIDCTINQKLTIAGNIQNFLIIKDSKVNADLVFFDGSCVKEQILLSNSYFKNIAVEKYFQSEKLSFIDKSKVTNNFTLTGTKINEIQVHNSYIKGNFENSKNENQHNFDSQSLSFCKSKIGGNIEIKDNLKIKEIIFNEVDVTGYLEAICYGEKIIFNNKNSFEYISFQVNLKNIEIEKSELYGKFSIQEKSIIKYFHISASIAYNEFIAKKSIINSLKIETNSILRSLNCEDVEINYISIEDTIFKGLVTTDLKQTEHLDIRDCKIYDNFHYSSSNTNKEKQLGFFLSNFFVEDSLSISDTNFQNITIENTIVGETLSISHISVDYDFSVYKLICSNSVRVDGNSKLKNLSFDNLYTPQINIENVSIDSNKINFSNSHLDSLYHFDLPKYEYLFESCKIEKLHFAEKTNPKDNIYTFIKCDFSLIEISNFNNLGNLFF